MGVPVFDTSGIDESSCCGSFCYLVCFYHNCCWFVVSVSSHYLCVYSCWFLSIWIGLMRPYKLE